VLVNNNGVVVKGSSLAQVFDRLEVLEATPNVVLECTSLGSLRPMTSKEKIQEIDEKWFHETETNNSKKQKRNEIYERSEIYGPW
jgi:ribulose-5-phosphate 4-epimerase/fuculose-1-phosphate aldolase